MAQTQQRTRFIFSLANNTGKKRRKRGERKALTCALSFLSVKLTRAVKVTRLDKINKYVGL